MRGKKLKKIQRERPERNTWRMAESATHGEWLRARQVALIVARLLKERSLISCSHESKLYPDLPTPCAESPVFPSPLVAA